MIICKIPSCEYVNIFVSQVVPSGITVELNVNQLVTIVVALADSSVNMQLCWHKWEVNNLQPCELLFPTATIPSLAGQHIAKM